MLTINDRDFLNLVRFVRGRFGINLEHKRQLIDARLAFDIKKRGYNDFSEYVSYIIAYPDTEECRHMINRLSTNYTFFFREPEYIDRICGDVIGDLLSHGAAYIRIWDAACSSGEEAYSVAMVLEGYRKLFHLPFDFEIIGTDINTEMLDAAKAGIYGNDVLINIPKHYKQFTVAHSSSDFEITDEIRQKIRWQYRNLLDEPNVRETYDIIFCRNVMIYFTPELRQEMTGKLYALLARGGYLFTGATESIDLERKYFRYIAPSFYQKR